MPNRRKRSLAGRGRAAAVLAAGAIFTAFGGLGARAEGRPVPSRFEVSVLWGSNRPALDSTYVFAFVPTLFGEKGTGSGGQSLTLRGNRSDSWSVAAAFFFDKTFGIEVLGTAFSTGLSGANSPYRIVLNYISRQPPFYTPTPATFERQTAWPDTSGEVKEKVLAVNAVVRFRPARVLAFAVSAGPAGYWVDGRAASLGYTKFTMGGHGVLFPYEYLLDLEFERTSVWGFDAGLEIALDLAPHISLAAEARWFAAGKIRVPFSFALHGDPLSYFPIDLGAEGIPVVPVEFDPGLFRISAGLKLRF